MKSCAFFGHGKYDYRPHLEQIKAYIIELIENHGTREFYNGYRGAFDNLCAEIVFELKETYPSIKNIMVLSYHPKEEFVLPKFIDESIYLLDKTVPPKFAISHTNQAIVDRADYIVSGVKYDWGGAWSACEYARRKKKIIIKLFETV